MATRMRCVALVTGLVLLAGCGESATTAPEPAAPTPSPTKSSAPSETAKPTEPSPPPADGTRIELADSDYGPMLFDRSGQAIYLFDRETTRRPNCYGACAEAWPPVLTNGLPQAGDGVQDRLLGTARRRDGSQQVTYSGHPLYFYAHEQPHQVLCHDVSEYGGLWLVVTADGTAAPH